jgi:dipeptidyl aminopeptidase/acylaminoacyl peptidase
MTGMDKRTLLKLAIAMALLFLIGCSLQVGENPGAYQPAVQVPPNSPGSSPSATSTGLPIDITQQVEPSLPSPLTETPTDTPLPTSTITLTPTSTQVSFEIGEEITIDYLRSLNIEGSEITFERELDPTPYYQQHIVSYIAEGSKIYGLLTIPIMKTPDEGFKAIVFNHGYIPPDVYRTTERYVAYVDYLTRSGFVVFKIDYRGHGDSEGQATGSYFSPGYTIDSIAALKSLQRLDFIDPDGIGMWGHSMAGNLVLRAMLIEPDIKAGVIWAGAVYSYDDFGQYGIDDNTYRPPATSEPGDDDAPRRRSSQIFEAYGRPDTQNAYWQAVSLTENIAYLNSPLQIHHAEDDPVVNIGYSADLAAVLLENGKDYEFYTYPGGGHNIISPYFDQAMQRTVEFFRQHLQ